MGSLTAHPSHVTLPGETGKSCPIMGSGRAGQKSGLLLERAIDSRRTSGRRDLYLAMSVVGQLGGQVLQPVKSPEDSR